MSVKNEKDFTKFLEKDIAAIKKDMETICNDFWSVGDDVKTAFESSPNIKPSKTPKEKKKKLKQNLPPQKILMSSTYRGHDLQSYIRKLEQGNKNLLDGNRTLRLEKSRLARKLKRQKLTYLITTIVLVGIVIASLTLF
jgi:hypothetical protein